MGGETLTREELVDAMEEPRLRHARGLRPPRGPAGAKFADKNGHKSKKVKRRCKT